MPILLCQTSDISDPGCKGFEVESNAAIINLFIVHCDGQFHAYINSCPHTGVNLEWLEDQFLDMDNTYIQCSTHDALFNITTGECIAGPCVGDSLTPIDLSVRDNKLYVDFQSLTTI